MDVLRLLAKSQRARAWSKGFLFPALWILLRSRMFGLVMDREIRRKLSRYSFALAGLKRHLTETGFWSCCLMD
jgi:hypothetical protein